MSGILAPIKQVLIDIKLNNPLDTATYYVRAVIKNSLSGETLDTLNLTDNGNKYFSSTWTTPNDPSGNGLQIVVFKTVYDDAGYTTESGIYGTTIENYVIRDLAGNNVFGGGWSGLSKKDIQEVVQKELSDLLKSIPSVDYVKIQKEINTEIHTEIQKSEDNVFTRVLEKMTEKIKQKVEQMFSPSQEIFTLQKEATKTFLTEAKDAFETVIREHTKLKQEAINFQKEQEKEYEQIKKGSEYFQSQLLETNSLLEKLRKVEIIIESQKKEEELQKKGKAEKFMHYAFNVASPNREIKKGAKRFIQYVNN